MMKDDLKGFAGAVRGKIVSENYLEVLGGKQRGLFHKISANSVCSANPCTV